MSIIAMLRRVWTARASRKRAQGSKRRDSHRSTFRPLVDLLEDRLAPAAVLWSAPAGGNWDNPGNWSSGKVPSSGDDVTINTPAPAVITVQAGDSRVGAQPHDGDSGADDASIGDRVRRGWDGIVSDTATLTGSYYAGGTISFSLTAPDGTVTPEGSATVTGDNTYSVPEPVLATEVGTYTWSATYSGDGNNNGTNDNGVNESVVTIQASPVLTTQALETASGVVGTAYLSDTATMSGNYYAGGTISFSLKAPDGTVTPEGSATVTGDNTYSAELGAGHGSGHVHLVGDLQRRRQQQRDERQRRQRIGGDDPGKPVSDDASFGDRVWCGRIGIPERYGYADGQLLCGRDDQLLTQGA